MALAKPDSNDQNHITEFDGAFYKMHRSWAAECLEGRTVVYKAIFDAILATMPPFVTAHTFCTSKVWSKIFGFLKEFAH